MNNRDLRNFINDFRYKIRIEKIVRERNISSMINEAKKDIELINILDDIINDLEELVYDLDFGRFDYDIKEVKKDE